MTKGLRAILSAPQLSGKVKKELEDVCKHTGGRREGRAQGHAAGLRGNRRGERARGADARARSVQAGTVGRLG